MAAVAVIGGGAAGLGAARTLLRTGVEVVLVEAGRRLGGNCVGLEVPGADGAIHAVDVGVSDFNRVTFTEFARLIDELGLETRPICGDAHFAAPTGESLWACQDGRWTFREGAASRPGLLAEIDRFRTRALEVLHDERFARCTLGGYLDHIGASPEFRDTYLYPRAMGSFPMPNLAPANYHARSLVRFWNIHGIVSDRPGDRRCVVGGMHRYVEAYRRWFEGAGGELRLGTRVVSARRGARRVSLQLADDEGRCHGLRVDQVIFAGHPSQVLPLLEDASAAERSVLSAFIAQPARVVVHHDEQLVGDDPSLFGAYNYLVPRGGLPRVRPTISFFPNRLGGLADAVPDTFVTMNPHREPRPDRILAERHFLHPIGCLANDRAAARLEALQGGWRTWFAGAWARSPFVHESAYTSGIDAARGLLAGSGSSSAVTRGHAMAS
ncbi:FAD-dependent oxidoreductase [Engelhardtia mirabilis]|uniref:Amine oxidase domain-containing protein n=1 Tax=Engelhardtia mirabilis TaxID=2528011 RepID=A0A518BEB8_9BACT|nr:hypothetical protein Pla133_03850 [Planctomycetes bacterium Pla133]QDU99646.1 hypothetical protein Pla86_03850 [Planctomycetes bacterium Pla86]